MSVELVKTFNDVMMNMLMRCDVFLLACDGMMMYVCSLVMIRMR